MNIIKYLNSMRKLEICVCAASAIIGGGIGAVIYFVMGGIVGGVGGWLVGIVWCYYMRKAVACVEHIFGSLLFAGVIFGALAGAADGVFLHFTCLSLHYSRFNGDLPMSFMLMIGLISGAIAGAVHGGLWGLVYSIIALRASRNKKLETAG